MKRKLLNISLILILFESAFCDDGTVNTVESNGNDDPAFDIPKFWTDLLTDVVEVISEQWPQSRLRRIVTPAIIQGRKETLALSDSGEDSEEDSEPILSSDEDDVRFIVHTNHKDPSDFFEVDLKQRHSKIPKIRNSSKVVFLIHGFFGKTSHRFPAQMKNAYLSSTPHTIILVDWEALARPRDTEEGMSLPLAASVYPSVAANVPLVGEQVFRVISHLLEKGVVTSLDQIHLVGHSLGAHVSANAGQLIKKKYGGRRVGRITGLDPAGVLFRNLSPDQTLDKSDANFVDVIHSSFIGVTSEIGHADYYPNGGQIAPHCIGKMESLVGFVSCNHCASFEYFTKTITSPPGKITACRCNSYQEFRNHCGKICPDESLMGEFAPYRARGKYFLDLDLTETD